MPQFACRSAQVLVFKADGNSINRNGEIRQKILNNAAGQNDCGVNSTISCSQLKYEGDRDGTEEIVREATALFDGSGC